MLIEVTIHSVTSDEGSVVVFGACRSDNGEDVHVAVDHRMAQDIVDALAYEDVATEVEVYQIL